MGCIESMNYTVLLKQISFAEARTYVKVHFSEVYEVEPGYKLHDARLIGVPPLLVAVDGDDVIFPFTKPCHGTFLLRAPGNGEIERLRARGSPATGKKTRRKS
ncbi:MAG: DUF1894 domain-containing protein [Methanomicrobiales archaeon]